MRCILNHERLTASCLSALVAIAAAVILTGNVRGQPSAPEQVSSNPKIVIPPPRRLTRNDTAAVQTESNGQKNPDSPVGETSTSSVPPITPLPESAVVPDSATRRDDSGVTPAPPPRLPIDTELIPGRVVQPIDLVNALRLTGVRNIDIAVTRQQISQPRPT